MCVFAAVTWPLPQSVDEVTSILESGSLDTLYALLSDAMGPCDSVRDDVESPWATTAGPIAGESVCTGLPQTQTTVFD